MRTGHLERADTVARRAAGLCLLAATISACRYEVRLDDPLDASDAATLDAADAPPADPQDAPPLDGRAPEDAGLADAPDAPARPCIAGVDVVPSPATAPSAAPTLAATGTLLDRRYALLLPPSARLSTTRTGLYVLDRGGATLDVVELDLVDGAGTAADTATVHRRRDAVGFLVLAPTEARLRDDAGGWTSIPLPMPPLVSRQREAGWLDDARFAYVGAGPGEPIVVLDTASASGTASPVTTAGAARVLFGLGAVVIAASLPDPAISEHDATLTALPTFRIDWPAGPIGDRLLGATLDGGRRWLVRDTGEFRAQTELYRVDAAGPAFVLGQMLLGPLQTESDDDLVTIVTSDGGVTVFDFTSDAFVPLVPAGATSLGLAERDDDGFVVVTREPAVTGEALVFRCVPN